MRGEGRGEGNTETSTDLVSVGMALLARLLQDPAPDKDREDSYRQLPDHNHLARDRCYGRCGSFIVDTTRGIQSSCRTKGGSNPPEGLEDGD